MNFIDSAIHMSASFNARRLGREACRRVNIFLRSGRRHEDVCFNSVLIVVS